VSEIGDLMSGRFSLGWDRRGHSPPPVL